MCRDCLPLLTERQDRQDRLTDEKLAFERPMTISSAQMKLIEMCGRDRGELMRLIGQIAQLRLAGKLTRLERQIEQGQRNGRQLPP